MADEIIDDKKADKADGWRERIADQERSGLSVKQFCKERGLAECSFYAWRKRLRETGPVRFALVEGAAARRRRDTEAHVEVVLVSGERLRICSGVDGATLRTVLEALRR